MTARLTAAAVASLALAVPALSAAATVKLKPGHHAVVAHVARAAADQIFTAPFPSTPIITPRYIYVPPSPSPLSAPTCLASGENCTALELCEYWGENC